MNHCLKARREDLVECNAYHLAFPAIFGARFKHRSMQLECQLDWLMAICTAITQVSTLILTYLLLAWT